MHFYDRRDVALLRVLTPLLGTAITPEMTCVVGGEFVRVALLQAYLANAGVLTARSLWLYFVSSPTLSHVCVILLAIESRKVPACPSFCPLKMHVGKATLQQQAVDTS